MSRAWTHWATVARPGRAARPGPRRGHRARRARRSGGVQRGGAFVLDPFDAYAAGLVTNPNVVVAGSIGAGKSTVVKMMLDRALERGRRVVVVDPKGEYARPRARLRRGLGRTGPRRLVRPLPRRRLRVDALATPCGERAGAPLERRGALRVDARWRGSRSAPTGGSCAALADALAAGARRPPGRRAHPRADPAPLVHGDLAGLFDGEGEPLDLSGRWWSLDLSAQWSSHSSSGGGAERRRGGPARRRRSARWGTSSSTRRGRCSPTPRATRWLQGVWKLARARGLSHVLVLHRFCDVARRRRRGQRPARARPRPAARVRDRVAVPPAAATRPARWPSRWDCARLEERYLRALPRGSRARALRPAPVGRARASPTRATPASSTPTRRCAGGSDRPSVRCSGGVRGSGVGCGPSTCVLRAGAARCSSSGRRQSGKTSSLVVPALLRVERARGRDQREARRR